MLALAVSSHLGLIAVAYTSGILLHRADDRYPPTVVDVSLPSSVALSRSGILISASEVNSCVASFNMMGELLAHQHTDSPTNDMAFLEPGHVAMCATDGCVRLLCAHTLDVHRVVDVCAAPLRCVSVSLDGVFIFCGSEEGDIYCLTNPELRAQNLIAAIEVSRFLLGNST